MSSFAPPRQSRKDGRAQGRADKAQAVAAVKRQPLDRVTRARSQASRVRQAGTKSMSLPPPNKRASRGRSNQLRSDKLPPPPEAPPLVMAVAPIEQNLRWQHLSRTLWVMLVVEEKPSVDNGGLNSILDVLMWRIQGQISEDEFIGLYKSWVAHAENAEGLMGPPATSRSSPKSRLVSFRQMLIMRGHRETDLDLMLALMINEQNKEIAQPAPAQGLMGISMGISGVVGALCTPQWLSLVQNVFFFVDSRGYGQLTFDELQHFVFATCYSRGDLRLLTPSNLATATLELLDSALLGEHPAATQQNVKRPMAFDLITLPMFKKYLVRSACGESVIAKALESLQFVSDTYQKRIVRGAFGQSQDVTSFPRLWEQAVQEQTGSGLPNSNEAVPPLVNFLLVDAPALLHRQWLQGTVAVDAAGGDLWNALQRSVGGGQNVDMTRDPTHQLILRVLNRYSELRGKLVNDMLACLGKNPLPTPPSQLLPLPELAAVPMNDPMRAWTDAQNTVHIDTPFMQMLQQGLPATPGQLRQPGYGMMGGSGFNAPAFSDANAIPQMQENSSAAANSSMMRPASEHALLSVPDAVVNNSVQNPLSAGDLAQMLESAVWEDVISIPESQDQGHLPWNAADKVSSPSLASPRNESEILKLVDLLIFAQGDEREAIMYQLKQLRANNGVSAPSQSQAPDHREESKAVDEDAARSAQELRHALRSMSENGPVSEDKIADMLQLGRAPQFTQPMTPVQPLPRPPSPLQQPVPESIQQQVAYTAPQMTGGSGFNGGFNPGLAMSAAAPISRVGVGSTVPGQAPTTTSSARKPSMTFGRRSGT